MSQLQYPSNNLPIATGNSGKVLSTDGETFSWINSGAVTIATQRNSGGTLITFSNIPQSYNHLSMIVRFTTDTIGNVYMDFNDAGISFTGGYHNYSTSTTVGGATSSGNTQPIITYVGVGSWSTLLNISIPDYATTKRKAFSVFGGGASGALGYSSFGASSQSSNTINKIKIGLSGMSFTDYTATLYGWN